jgi:hypothetical protein
MAGFLGPLGPNEIESGILNDHVLGATDDKTLVMVSITTLITRASVIQANDAYGYGEFGNCSTFKYFSICHDLWRRLWTLIS